MTVTIKRVHPRQTATPDTLYDPTRRAFLLKRRPYATGSLFAHYKAASCGGQFWPRSLRHQALPEPGYIPARHRARGRIGTSSRFTDHQSGSQTASFPPCHPVSPSHFRPLHLVQKVHTGVDVAHRIGFPQPTGPGPNRHDGQRMFPAPKVRQLKRPSGSGLPPTPSRENCTSTGVVRQQANDKTARLSETLARV